MTTGRRIGTGAGAVASQALSSSRAHTPQQRSRLTQQSQPSPPRGRKAPSSVGDEDAEGEEDEDAEGDMEGEEGDEEIYCECQSMSYGEVSVPCFKMRIEFPSGICLVWGIWLFEKKRECGLYWVGWMD